MKKYTRVLTIAGSDSGGGAGIQADLKTFSACGCFGMSVITAVTAQNTLGITALHPIPISVIEAQIHAVMDDIGTDGIKIGMLYSKDAVECVGRVLQQYNKRNIILDPVMTASSGDPLIHGKVTQSMKTSLFPGVRLLTPNIPEAEHLLNYTIGNDLADAARQMAREFSFSVLVKAGHMKGDTLVDVLYDNESGVLTKYANLRVKTDNTHGTGCTLSSAITSFAAKGMSLPDAVRKAEEYLNNAIIAGTTYQVGKGCGPVHHFHEFWQ
jgi:hydroxymethylpyrimidine/phosphomethylpyrimidine kinase